MTDTRQRPPWGLLCLIAFSMLALAGCSRNDEAVLNGPEDDPTDSAGPNAAATDSGSSDAVNGAGDPSSSQGQVTLAEADAEDYEQVIADARGRVVLVDFWATWCVPCKKNLPKVVSYQRDFGDERLAVVTVSIDDADAHEEALQFLTSIGATMTNLRSKWGAGTESAEQFDFSGEVPFYKLYDRQGKLRYQFSPSADLDDNFEPIDDLKKRIEELLGE